MCSKTHYNVKFLPNHKHRGDDVAAEAYDMTSALIHYMMMLSTGMEMQPSKQLFGTPHKE